MRGFQPWVVDDKESLVFDKQTIDFHLVLLNSSKILSVAGLFPNK